MSWAEDSTGGEGTWGTISGILSNQTDLQEALGAKLSLAGGTITGDLTVSAILNISTLQVASAYTFPVADGSANYVLKTDGSGTLRWEADATGGDPTWGGNYRSIV